MLVLTKLNKYNIKKNIANRGTYINHLLNGIVYRNNFNSVCLYLIRKNKAYWFIGLHFQSEEFNLYIEYVGSPYYNKIYDSCNFFERCSRKLWKLIDMVMIKFEYDEESYNISSTKNQWISIYSVNNINYRGVLNQK